MLKPVLYCATATMRDKLTNLQLQQWFLTIPSESGGNSAELSNVCTLPNKFWVYAFATS